MANAVASPTPHPMAPSFDERASTWDTAERIERARFIADRIRSQCGSFNGYRILDFGAGTGLIGFNLLEGARSLALVDSSEGMRKVLAEKASASGRAGDILIASSLDDPVLRPASFDLIVTSMAMHHVKDTRGCIARFAALLRDGGRLCIVDLEPDDGTFHAHDPDFDGHHGFDPEKLSRLCAVEGFTELHRDIILRGEKDKPGGAHPYALFLLAMERCMD